MTRRGAFTLVELLVIVTIIVVLLALLMPAMSRAVYAAQLSQCMGKQKTVVQAVVDYAWQNKKSYPYRGLEKLAYQGGAKELGPMGLVQPTINYDLRPPLKGYVAVNAMLQCPLVEPVDLEVTREQNPNLFIETSYMMFWGWRYTLQNGRKYAGMDRLGDEWESPEGAVLARYNLLFSDMDLRYGWNDLAEASHPDRNPSVMYQWIFVNTFGWGASWNFSRWSTPLGTVRRGLVDDNFGYDDGSVRRVDNVKTWTTGDRAMSDERMHEPRLQFDLITPQDRFAVPAR